MNRLQRDPVVRLLTNAQAASELGVSLSALDRLVLAGEIKAVQVSARRGRRFWPRDVAAWRRMSGARPVPGVAAGAAPGADPAIIAAAPGAAVPVAATPIAATLIAAQRPGASPTTRRPHWLPFAVPTKRVQPTYIGFADAATLTRFLRLRATPTG
jgi:excisionase family DNA binding protein